MALSNSALRGSPLRALRASSMPCSAVLPPLFQSVKFDAQLPGKKLQGLASEDTQHRLSFPGRRPTLHPGPMASLLPPHGGPGRPPASLRPPWGSPLPLPGQPPALLPSSWSSWSTHYLPIPCPKKPDPPQGKWQWPKQKGKNEPSHLQLNKRPTGIQGLDEITGGGLPRGAPHPGVRRRRLRQDPALGMEFVVRGAVNYGEPGVFMSFEETTEELAINAASLGSHWRTWRARSCWPCISSISSAATSKRPASTIWKASSSAWGSPSTPSKPNGWCWTRWRPCSRGYPTS